MALTHSQRIEVKRVKGKGRGVFAVDPIAEGALIERVPVLVMPLADVKNADEWTGLASYVFMWGVETVALALGYGSLYNHSYKPNARYNDEAAQTKTFVALRDIAPGEEITINYNGDPDDASPVGFTVLEIEPTPAVKPTRRRKITA